MIHRLSILSSILNDELLKRDVVSFDKKFVDPVYKVHDALLFH